MAQIPPPTAYRFNANQIRFLQEHGFTAGLIKTLETDQIKITKRCWILDNSISMNVMDSHRLAGSYDNIQNVAVTRWEELSDCVTFLSNMAATLHMTTRFALLNDPGCNVGSQYFSVAETGNNAQDLQNVQRTMKGTRPNGPTNLVKTLLDLRNFILKSNHPMTSIVIATQGLPTNEHGQSSSAITQQFIEILKSFQGLPVSICIRLCTDNDRAIDFYNNLEYQLHPSLPYDVLDDFFGEALEVYLKNPWLNYGLPLHRFRELGLYHKLFDCLDDKALTPFELRDFCTMFFSPATPLPDPCSHWNDFFNQLSYLVSNERQTWNPVTRKVAPWINLIQLQNIYGGKSNTFATTPSHAVPTATTPLYQQPQQRTQTQYIPQPQTMHTPSYPQPPTPPAKVASAQPSREDDNFSSLKKTILLQWALAPPSNQSLRPINYLLGTLQTNFPPAYNVQANDYFNKWKPLSQDALSVPEHDVVKRAFRKAKFFLHPDKLPNEFDDVQKFLCKLLWDVLADAWEIFDKK